MAGVLSALVSLTDGVRAWFAANEPSLGVSVPPFGVAQRAMKLNEGTGCANRIVFMPGLIANGDIPDVVDFGDLTRGHKQSTNPRTLFQWNVPSTMSVWAADTSSADAIADEQAQIIAVTNLLELAMRAVHNARVRVNPDDPASPLVMVGLANIVTPSKVRLVTKNVQRNLGREVLVTFAMQTPLFDRTYDVAFPAPVVARNPAA
jgi:hypothetical protein